MHDAMPTRRFQVLNALVWTLYGAASTGMGVVFARGVSSGIVFVSLALAVLLWLGSAAMRTVVLRRGWLERDARAAAVRLIGAVALVSALIQAAMAAMLIPAMRLGWLTFGGSGTGYSAGTVVGYWINTMIVLGLWTGAWVGWRSIRHARASEVAALRAQSERHLLELDALRARLNPHFVFNALNNLRALILEDPGRARELVTRLSGTLRHALEHSAGEWTRLAHELDVVGDYLAVESVHYEQRLRVEIDVAAAARDARIPPMALQLLAENAIKHGIARTPGGGTLAISGRIEAGDLRVEVVSPGTLEEGAGGTGVGLAFLRSRLERTGGRFALHERAGRVHAVLEVPQ